MFFIILSTKFGSCTILTYQIVVKNVIFTLGFYIRIDLLHDQSYISISNSFAWL